MLNSNVILAPKTINIIDSLTSGTKNIPETSHVNTFLKDDINNIESYASLINQDSVAVHLAALGNVIESVRDPVQNFHANVSSTQIT